jgi:hypothetical protein
MKNRWEALPKGLPPVVTALVYVAAVVGISAGREIANSTDATRLTQRSYTREGEKHDG